MKKSLVILVLLVGFIIAQWHGEKHYHSEEHVAEMYAKYGAYILPKEYFKLKLEYLLPYSGEGLEGNKEMYQKGFIPCVDIMEKTYKKVKNTFKKNTKVEIEIKKEIWFLSETMGEVIYYSIKENYDPRAKEYEKKIEKMKIREDEREDERENHYKLGYSKKIAKIMSFLDVYEKSYQENKKIMQKILAMKVYPLSSINSYFGLLIKLNKLKEMDKIYQKNKNKITDKEWMRSKYPTSWLKSKLKQGYDALHKQDPQKYPIGDQIVKEIDDKIKSLQDKGMKFWSKWN